MVRLATLPRNTGATGSSPKTCEDGGCTKTTREGKPFCPDHVDEHPYVKNIQTQIQATKDERNRVRRIGAKAVNMGGATVKEILLILKLQGTRTVRRISREVNLENALVENYVTALEAAGKVKTGKTTRGDAIVCLPHCKQKSKKTRLFE